MKVSLKFEQVALQIFPGLIRVPLSSVWYFLKEEEYGYEKNQKFIIGLNNEFSYYKWLNTPVPIKHKGKIWTRVV